MIVRNRSCPAVSQICSLIRLPSSSMVLILKSILHDQWKRLVTTDPDTNKQYGFLDDMYPIVVMKLVVNEPSEKRKSRQLFPTPERFYKGLSVHNVNK